MKKLVGIITVLALFTSVASAELLKNFKANGSLETLNITATNSRTFNKDNAPADKYSTTDVRVIIGATFDLNDDVDAKVTLMKDNRQYGDSAYENANTVLNQFTFQEAYINLKGVLGMDHKLGKQHYGNPGDLIIYYGNAGWFVPGLGAGLALDGWSATYKKDKLTLGAVSAKVTESTTLNMSDKDLYGITVAYDLGYEYLNPGFYYYQSDDRVTPAADMDKLTVMGIKANGKFMGFNYGAEYAMNGGSKDSTVTTDYNYKGTLMALNADYGLDVGFGKFIFMGRQVISSGDKVSGGTSKDDKKFYAINANYRPGLIMGGVGTAAVSAFNTQPGNLTVTELGANLTPNIWDSKLNLDAKMYNLKYTEATNDGIGTELDLVASWMHSDDVCLKLALASFTPDEDIAPTNDDAVYLMNFYVNVKF